MMQGAAAVALSCSGYLAKNGRLASALQDGVGLPRAPPVRRRALFAPAEACVCADACVCVCARARTRFCAHRRRRATRCWRGWLALARCC